MSSLPRALSYVLTSALCGCIDDGRSGDVAVGRPDLDDGDGSGGDIGPDVTARCTDNSGCPTAADACQQNVCDRDTGKCSLRAQPGDTACDDHDPCTRSDRCGGGGDAGTCIGHDPVVCLASGDCGEVGVCNPLSGVCTQPSKEDGTLCEDALALDQVSPAPGTCAAGRCQRLPIVEAGGYHVCAVLSDGGMRCWGRGLQGALGRGDELFVGNGFGPSVAEAGALALPAVRSFTLGPASTCAVVSDGMRCWGDNAAGGLGTGDFEERGGTPESAAALLSPIDFGADFVPVAAAIGAFDGCALSDSGAVKCWGEGVMGYPGVGSVGTPGDVSIAQIGPVSLGSNDAPFPVEAFDHGFTHVCALSGGNLRCWGGPAAALGIGASEPLGDDEQPGTAPFVNQGWRVASFSTYSGHTCAISSDGELYCWGRNSEGQLGDGSTILQPVATNIFLDQGHIASRVAAGFMHTCVLLTNGAVMCWGANGDGQLGRGDALAGPRFARDAAFVNLGGVAHDITAGNDFNCVVMRDGAVRCFGRGFFGSLGNGSDDNVGDEASDLPPVPIIF